MKKTMLLPLLIAALVSPWLPAAAAAAERHQQPPQQCGGVDIPFPFGIGHGYLETPGSKAQPFNVTCSHRADDDGAPRPKPTPVVDGMEVLRIDVLRGRIYTKSMVSSWCYNATTGSMGNQSTWWYDSATTTTFRVSDEDNRLTVVGCNAFAYVWSHDGGADDKYLVGCNATCSRGVRSLADGSCSNLGGCCQAPIRPGSSFTLSFDYDSGAASDIPARLDPASPCVYAMVVQKEAFKFRAKYVTTDELLRAAGGFWEVPMVLDWAVGNHTCEAAQRNRASYACRSDISECANAKNGGPGYTCSCPKGYDGNPYLPDGCKGINPFFSNFFC